MSQELPVVGPSPDSQLGLAIRAVQEGNYAAARRAILAELERDPHNLAAWSWACEVAISKGERIHCLEQILLLDPTDRAAQRQLAHLKGVPATSATDLRPAGAARRAISPMAYLATAGQVLIVLLVIAVAAGAVFALPQSSLLGLRGPDFDSLTISDSFDQIRSDDFYWQIAFEKPHDTIFEGLVRHNSAIHMNRFRILTQDILVTTGDFAEPELVNTSVNNHRFHWTSRTATRPAGAINLLHTIPAREEIYRQLSTIQEGDEVRIVGRDVLGIKVYNLEGKYLGEWHDEGCNTLVVQEVQLVER